MTLKEDIADMIEESSASLFSVARSDDLEDAPEGHRPSDIMNEAKSVIVIGQKMLDAQIDLQNTDGSYYTVSSRESMIKGHITFVSRELDRTGYEISRFLEKKGYKAYHQMASEGGVDGRELVGFFSLKHAAEKAGMGVIGKNSLIITSEFGPRVRLTGLITDAELSPDNQLDKDFCQNCENFCIDACPADALKNPIDGSSYQIDKFKCCNSLATRAKCRGCLTKCPVGNRRV